MSLKKLKFSEKDKTEIKEMREKLQGLGLVPDELAKTYAGACGGLCEVTCSYHCEPTCGLSCEVTCTGTCASLCVTSSHDAFGCSVCAYTIYSPWPI